jgi:hypothetical protein
LAISGFRAAESVRAAELSVRFDGGYDSAQGARGRIRPQVGNDHRRRLDGGFSAARHRRPYDDELRTIYLPSDWRGHTAAELSIVVHEMVHHIQNTGHLKYECGEAREKLAFKAQEQWLGLFGQDLETQFGLDSLTLLVRTNCGL